MTLRLSLYLLTFKIFHYKYIHPTVSAQPRKPVLMRLSKKYFMSPMSFSWKKVIRVIRNPTFLSREADQSCVLNYCYHYSQGMENANVPLLHTDEDDFQVLHLLFCHPYRQAELLYCGRLRQSNGHQVDSSHGLQSMFCFVTQKSLEMICSGRKES